MAILEASPFYQELKKTVFKEGIEQGIEQGRVETQEQERRKTVETLMQLRFETIDPELEAIAPKLMALPPEEFSRLILQRSREELLGQFTDN